MRDDTGRSGSVPKRPTVPTPKRGAQPSKPGAKPAASAKPASSAKTSASAKPAASGTGRKSAKPAAGRPPAQQGAAARSGWLSGIRFSGFSLIMMGVLVLAVVVLAPTIAAFAQQRQQIAELRAAVSAEEEEVQRLRDERERWNDDTFIVTQARERLYYVMPGEVSYLVIDDRTAAAKADATAEVSAEVTESKGDWMTTLLDSVFTAGLAPDAVPPTDQADDPTTTTVDPTAEETR
jgi:cell division protein FtsB